MRAVDQRDAAEFVGRIFDDWFPWLVRYAYRVSGNFAAAEDASQAAFLALYCALCEGKEIEQPKGWLLCVVKRQIARQAGREDAASDDECETIPVLPYPVAEPFARDEIIRHFSVLTAREEEVMLLRLQSMKYREIADQLGIATTSVNTLLGRAIRKLRSVLASEAQHDRVVPKKVKRVLRRTH